MKIIHLSDPHLLGNPREHIFGLNPALRLKKAIRSIEQHHSDAEFITITGDLVDFPTKDAYTLLKNIIKKCKIQIFPILGNHDSRKLFSNIFPDLFNDDGFVQYDITVKKNAFIFLDSVVEGKSHGKLCKKRLAWLRDALLRHKKRDCYLFMHHAPVPTGLYEIDTLANLKNSTQLWKLLQEFSNVKHIAFGHIHRIMHSSYNGVSLHATRSTAFQLALTLNDTKEMLTNMEKPTYAIMQLKKYGTQIHHHEYYNENRIYECQGRWD